VFFWPRKGAIMNNSYVPKKPLSGAALTSHLKKQKEIQDDLMEIECSFCFQDVKVSKTKKALCPLCKTDLSFKRDLFLQKRS